MITVGMNYHVIEGKQADFEEKFAAVITRYRPPMAIAVRRCGKM